jgi:peptide deformylase
MLSRVTIPILPDTDPLLRTVSAPVEAFDAGLVALAQDMATSMIERRGLGLAAVQIGKPIRLIVVNNDGKLLFMANPKISRQLRRLEVEREGCLSVPASKWKRIARPAKCDVSWQSLDGSAQSGTFKNMVARAVQHEIEHLDGILITDHPVAV